MPFKNLTTWRLLRTVLTAMLVACGGAPRPSDSRAPRADDEATTGAITWRSWDEAAFAEARDTGRLLLVDVGIEGCTACRWMYEDTYNDPEVVARVNAGFVPVAVDADVRPDVGERYARWGWPATIFLTGDGTQVMAIRGNKRPRTFLPILEELLRRQRAGTLERDADTPIALGEADDAGPLGAACATAVTETERGVDRERGGYGSSFRFAHGAPLRYALFRAHTRGDDEARAHALRTLTGLARLIDPVFGGIYSAAQRPDFSDPIVEKRTIHQAPMMAAYAEAYRATGDAQHLDAAREIDRYLREWMRADDGTFYTTQEDRPLALPEDMTLADYYALGDAERRAIGIPPIDHGVYTDLNARVIEAYVRLYEATGSDDDLAMATTAAERLLRERQRPDGAMGQTTPTDALHGDDRMRAFVAHEITFPRAAGTVRDRAARPPRRDR